MVEDQQELEWLASLRDQPQEQEKEPRGEEPRAAEGPSWERAAQADMVEDLREQVIQAEEELGDEEKGPLAQLFQNLQPGQRLVLAVLLFLNVAMCGCMALVMAGRVVLPF